MRGIAASFEWIAQELGPHTYVNLMSQYHPAGRVDRDHYGKIYRCVTRRGMEDAFSCATACGLNRIEGRCPPLR